MEQGGLPGGSKLYVSWGMGGFAQARRRGRACSRRASTSKGTEKGTSRENRKEKGRALVSKVAWGGWGWDPGKPRAS